MPKMKTHRTSAKRFKVTGTGKVTRRQANRHHGNERLTSKRLRRLKGDQVLNPNEAKRVKRMLGR
ncbi:MAG: 50S ribosomal protein L35 [Acidimicrobiales bacterium]|nr:50S ribosomal protein L35 [Acidimicrobiales bacterium]